MHGDPHTSARYYRKALPATMWRRILRAQQDRIYRRFAAHFPPDPGRRIVDIGVNGALADPDLYFLESRYPHRARIVACGLEPPGCFRRCFPEARYLQVQRGAPLPFADRAFDLAFCSAVIEHVGDRAAQAAFLGEVLRVARSAFITTPNRWYPVELHTLVPLLHYLPAPVYRRAYRQLGFDFFAEEANLNLLDRRALASMLPAGSTIETHQFLGAPSNLLAIVRR
jgi:SAM-dependent methyltransferase